MKQIPLAIGAGPEQGFENFLPGPNAAAATHLQGLHAGAAPVYLWGAAGSGKTHLLKAVRESLREQGATVGWLDPSMAAPPEYDERWAVVLMDDVHAYNAVQQHAAFSWFVQAQALQRGVLSTGLLPPADLKLREDLRTRLGWGHVFELHVLSEPERRAVLRQAADARGLFLGDEVMDFILARFSRDLGSLMQLLEHLDSYALQTQRAITIPLIKSMLENE